MQKTSQASPQTRAARLALLAIFFINGSVYFTFAPRIPDVRRNLALRDDELGLALLGMALGLVLAYPLVNWGVARFGSRRMVRITAFGATLSLLLLAQANSLPTLALSLLVLGAFNGSMDVSMNAHAVEIEDHYPFPIMSTFHGFFSVAGVTGAIISGAMIRFGVSVPIHLSVMSVLLFVSALVAGHFLLPRPEKSATESGLPAFVRPNRTLLLLGVIMICGFLSEGAIIDWSTLYMERLLGGESAFAVAGFAAFTGMMTIGRLTGDWLTDRVGAVAIVRWGSVLSAVGVGMAIVIGQPVVAAIGFGMSGAGLSVIVPLAFSASGRVPGIPSGAGVAMAALMGYSGFLLGPPIIGFTAEQVSLRIALGIPVVLALVMLASSNVVRTAEAGHALEDAAEAEPVVKGVAQG